MDNLAEKTKTQRKEGIKQTQKMKTWKIRKQANMDDKEDIRTNIIITPKER